MRVLNQDTETLILQELFNLNHKIDKYQESTERHFEELRGEIKTMNGRMTSIEGKVASIEGRVASIEEKNVIIEGKIASIEERMVTKEDIKKFATKEELKREMSDVSQIFKDTFSELQRGEDNLRLELFEKAN